MGHLSILKLIKVHYNYTTFTGLELLNFTIFNQEIPFKIFCFKSFKNPNGIQTHDLQIPSKPFNPLHYSVSVLIRERNCL